MKYLAAVAAFVAVHLVFLYLRWLSGAPFERDSGMLFIGILSLYVGGISAGLTVIFWKDKK